MDVPTIKTRLAAIQGTITGVNRAYAQGPKGLPEGDLPIFVNFTGPATVSGDQTGDFEERTFVMRLYVKPVQQGIDGEAEAACEPFFARVWSKFLARPGLGLGTVGNGPLAGVLDTRWLGDSGIAVLRYNAMPFVGIEFRLQVVGVLEVAYATYE